MLMNWSDERDDLISLNEILQDAFVIGYKDLQRLFYICGKYWVGNDIENSSIIHLYNNIFIVAIFKKTKEIKKINFYFVNLGYLLHIIQK